MKSKLIIPIFLLVGVLAACVLRFFQYMSLIDFNTGFFYDGAELAGILIYVLMGIVAVAAVILMFVGKTKGGSAYTVSPDGMGSHATQVLGISELLSAFIIVIRFFEGCSTARMICSGGIALILLVSGFLQLKNTVPPTITGHIKIIAAALMFPIIAEYYESDLIMHQRSDKLIIMLSYIMIGAFFASSARFYSRLETPNSRMRELISSVPTFILCSVHVLPKLLAYAFGGTAVKGMPEPDLIVSAGMIISGAFIATLFFTKKTKEIIPVMYDEEVEGKNKKSGKNEPEPEE
ncbi:MAG: hypothetical protein K5876_05660 [Ruminiclostridium sp.]|nr:hypothetical protein [Ruminiclostridium sp.]